MGGGGGQPSQNPLKIKPPKNVAPFCNKKSSIGEKYKKSQTKLVPLEDFSEEPKFGNKSGTILGNLPPICRKTVPFIRKKSKYHTRNLC